MSYLLANRADCAAACLLAMKRDAIEEDQFALGYMIQRIGSVLEMAHYDPNANEVETKAFDVTYRQWIESALAEEGMMSENDREHIQAFWNRERERYAA